MQRALVLAAALAAIGAATPAAAAGAVPWCGNDRLSTDRPDALGGRKVHVIYAIPSDGEDRFATVASQITTGVGAVAAWWAREDPASVPRFDLFPFPACASAIGGLDLSFARLPNPAASYRTVAGRLRLIAGDVAPDFADPAKKYLVFYDGPVADEPACGSAFGRDDPGRGAPVAVGAIYVRNRPTDPGCGVLGLELYPAKAIAHELLHMLGAVQDAAPHSCAASPGHICGDPLDVMAQGGESSSLADDRLDRDRDRDDYYEHSGTWWDARTRSGSRAPLPRIGGSRSSSPARSAARPSSPGCRGSTARPSARSCGRAATPSSSRRPSAPAPASCAGRATAPGAATAP